MPVPNPTKSKSLHLLHSLGERPCSTQWHEGQQISGLSTWWGNTLYGGVVSKVLHVIWSMWTLLVYTEGSVVCSIVVLCQTQLY